MLKVTLLIPGKNVVKLLTVKFVPSFRFVIDSTSIYSCVSTLGHLILKFSASYFRFTSLYLLLTSAYTTPVRFHSTAFVTSCILSIYQSFSKRTISSVTDLIKNVLPTISLCVKLYVELLVFCGRYKTVFYIISCTHKWICNFYIKVTT